MQRILCMLCFFFSSRRRHTRLQGDWSSDVCSSDLQSYGAAMHCNGNGACYNFDPDDAMCPSWKATRQRVHSPKGRASLMREWLRLQRSEEHTSELQSPCNLVCRLLLEKNK